MPPEHLQWVLGVDESCGGAEEARRFPARRHRAEDDLPVPAGARRRRRADPARDRRKTASPRSARSKRRSRSSSARRAASTIARSTTSPSACITCGTGSPTCSKRGLAVKRMQRTCAGEPSHDRMTDLSHRRRRSPPRHRQGRDRDARTDVRDMGRPLDRQPAAPARQASARARST